MPSYHFIPKSSLLFRNAKPFGANDRADTLDFPLPSTLAGALRTMYGDEIKIDFSVDSDKLLRETISGPLLTRISSDAKSKEILFPSPADSVAFDQSGGAPAIHRLKPVNLREAEGVDLPEGLLPIGLLHANSEKPSKKQPRYWLANELTKWLTDDMTDKIPADSVGIQSLPLEIRTQIAMDNETLTAENSKLFQTACLDFGEQQLNDGSWHGHHYGLLVNASLQAKSAYRRLGGESRLAFVERADKMWPDCPEELVSALIECSQFRVQFVTPAIFDNGWKPRWLNDELTGEIPGTGLNVKLCAAAIPRWQSVSGWDMRKSQQGQRPLRRMVPAGSVFWFKILDSDIESSFEIASLWLHKISDQRINEGFGLVVPGTWKSLTQ